MAIIVEVTDNGMVNRLTNEPVDHRDIDAALDAGDKVFVTFGGDPVEVIKIETIVVDNRKEA